jgi:hypothetical protein
MSRKLLPAVVLLLVVLVYLLEPAYALASSNVFAPGDGGDVPCEADAGDVTLEPVRDHYIYFFPIIMAWQAHLPDENCTHFVDNQASADGDGSPGRPWDNIAGHVDDLEAGDVMCVRGDLSAPGRVYTEPTIFLDEDANTSSGTDEAPIVVRPYLGEHVVLHTTGVNMLEFRGGVSYWQFAGFVFDKESRDHYAVHFRWATHNVIRDCEIHNGGEEGIHISYGEHNVIENCEIYDFDAGPNKDAHAILIGGGHDNVIRNNEIYNVTGDGVQLYPQDSRGVSGTLIEGNHFYTTMGPCSENAVDVKVGYPIIRGNVMHGYRPCDGRCGGSGGTIGEAIVVHQQTKGALIDGNEIYDSGSGIRVYADNVTITNNVIRDIVVDPDAWSNIGIQLCTMSGVDIVNNTFANVPRYVLTFYRATEVTLLNNLFYNTASIGYWEPGTGTADYNGWFRAADTVSGPHDLAGNDPGFLAPGNYRLRGNSPVVDAGDNASAPAYDFDGNSRPYGPGVDLGAFEVQ